MMLEFVFGMRVILLSEEVVNYDEENYQTAHTRTVRIQFVLHSITVFKQIIITHHIYKQICLYSNYATLNKLQLALQYFNVNCYQINIYYIRQQYYSPNFWMILQMDKVRGFANIPVFHMEWTKIFHSKIVSLNDKYRKRHRNIIDADTRKKQQQFITQIKFMRKKHMNCQQQKVYTYQTLHNDYSNFIPLRKQYYKYKNQCERQLSYLSHLQEKDYIQEKQKIEQEVLQSVQSIKKFKQKVQSNYKYFLSFTDKINLHTKLLSFGTKFLSQLPNIKSLIYQLCQCEQIFDQKRKFKSNISLTVDKGNKINAQSISMNMKCLYCPLCFIYDCSLHIDHQFLMSKLKNYHYISMKNKKPRSQHILNSLKMLSIDSQDNIQGSKCSKQCYRNIIQLRKNSLYFFKSITKCSAISDLTKSLIIIGIQMFSFQPCDIIAFLPKSQLTCADVFNFLQNQYNLRFKILNKFYQNENQLLTNQQAKTNYEETRNMVEFNRSRRNKKTNRKKYIEHNNKQISENNQAISICVHHFLNRPSSDTDCKNCICRARGYCLPSCLCSSQCTIMKIGCNCKKINQLCNSNYCPCYKQSKQCIPQICGKNCSGPENRCRNQQIQKMNYKKLKIYKSRIPYAGLGLFTKQNINENNLVTIYLGQKVDLFSLQLRDKLRVNNSFYNFQLKNIHLDSRIIGNKSRFINHISSNKENLKVKIINSCGQDWIALYAKTNIRKGSQLYFDYDGDGQIAKNHPEKYPFIANK